MIFHFLANLLAPQGSLSPSGSAVSSQIPNPKNSKAEAFDAYFNPKQLNFQALRAFSEKLSNAEFLNLFQERLNANPNLGSVCSAYLEEDSSELYAIKTLVEQFVQKHCLSFLTKFKQTHRIEEAVSHVSLLSLATCPPSLSPQAKAVHAYFTAWLYLIDDAVGKLRSKVRETKVFQRYFPAKYWLEAYLKNINKYCLNCLEAALEGKNCPKLPEFKELLQGHELSSTQVGALIWLNLFTKKTFNAMALLGQTLYALSRELAQLSPNPHLLKQEAQAFSIEVRSYFLGLEAEMQAAPTEAEAYLSRHAQTGAVRPCLQLNALLLAWQTGIPSQDFQHLSQTLVQQAIIAADRAVLCSNETCFLKDLGEEEESLVALLTAEQLFEQALLNPKDFPINTQKAQGQLLWDYGESEAAFVATKKVFQMLEDNLSKLIQLGETLNQTSDKPLLASVFTSVLMRWALGYALFNPLSKRYGRSFRLQQAVLEDRFEVFQKLILSSKAQTSA